MKLTRITYSQEKEQLRLLEEEEKHKKEQEEKFLQDQLQKEEAIKRQIQQALNGQTYEQFREYAEQQYPGDPEKQASLIRQLQEQHYIQYMQQVQAAQRTDSIDGSQSDEKSKEIYVSALITRIALNFNF